MNGAPQHKDIICYLGKIINLIRCSWNTCTGLAQPLEEGDTAGVGGWGGAGGSLASSEGPWSPVFQGGDS